MTKRRAVKLLEFSTDPALLTEMLGKLKDKEIRLEADLAIKEFPEVVRGITEVVLALSDVDRVLVALRACEQTAGSSVTKMDAVIAQIENHVKRLEVARAAGLVPRPR